MTSYPWESLLSPQDAAVIREAGYADRGAVSDETRTVGDTPAILVIDVQVDQVGPDVPITDAIAAYPTAMGEVAWRALEHIQSLLAVARANDVPILYARIDRRRPDLSDEATRIHDAVEPEPGDVVIEKTGSSAFHGTACLTHLVEADVDTVVVVGSSASGCVRATAVDAQQYGFDVIVPEECVFDRVQASKKITLLDLWMKYATVVDAETANEYVSDPAGGIP